MKIGVLGTGMVGGTIASKLVALGHEVMMGSRSADDAKARTWARAPGPTGRVGTFAETSAFGELVFNCTQGTGSMAALQAASARNLDGKILDLLESFGWKDAIDLGDISTARATEGYVPLWLSLWKQLGTLSFNINVVR